MSAKSVMVYRLDSKTMSKEPLGILLERRKEERGDNIAGMVRLARKEFDGMENGSGMITVGEYVAADPILECSTDEHSPHPKSHFTPRGKE